MNYSNLTAGLALFSLLALAPGLAEAASDTQGFDVTVDSVLTITAPAASSASLEVEDQNQAFPTQGWTIGANDPGGASVSFDVSAPFTHATDATYQADVRLDLAIGSSESAAGWSVSTANDSTDFGNATPNTDATVVAASTDAGNATLDLTVTFLSTDHSILAAGTYSVTVTGTLTAN